MNINGFQKVKFLKSTINFSQDIINIVEEYIKIMDCYFQDEDNKKNSEFCYDEYEYFKKQLMDKVKERGLDKWVG